MTLLAVSAQPNPTLRCTQPQFRGPRASGTPRSGSAGSVPKS